MQPWRSRRRGSGPATPATSRGSSGSGSTSISSSSATRGRGQVVGIVGEAGIGKSRLVFELRQRLRGEDVTYLRGRCLSYGSAVPYLPLVDILRHAFRITEADGPERIRDRVHAGLRELEIEPDEAAPFLLRLFGVREGAERLELLSDEVMRVGKLHAFRQLN